KYKGYVALLENDNLKAYYIFKALSQKSRALAIDPDIEKYLGIAESRLQERYFFTDETFNLRKFETARNVRFKIDRKDGSTDLFFISGVTNRGTGDGFVQYLRGLHVFSIDSEGNFLGGTFTPYAKLSAVSARYFNDDARLLLGIEQNVQSVPFILLHSVDRNAALDSGAEFPVPSLDADEDEAPSAAGTEGLQQNDSSYLILPMEFSDFALIQEASGQIQNMPLLSLLHFIRKAKQYGFAEEVFAQALLNRLFYPLFMLIFLICLACLAWNGRTPPHSLFKLKWAVLFPIFCGLFIGIYKAVIDFFCLLNYGILYTANVPLMIPAGLAVYILLLFLASLSFLACKDSSKE
ncbi:MAG: hypothetical protein K2H09_01015, partial [Treponemataceae bacterium]|nr:hypothetical protein [Treponemataceae bacterium]